MDKKLKNLNIRYFSLQVLYWGTAVVMYAYMTQILEFKGYTEVEIGILNAVKLLIGVGFQMWIGTFADKHVYSIPLKYIVAVLSLGTMLLTIAIFFIGHQFFIMFFIFAALGMTYTTISPLIDSMSLLYINHGQNINYAKGRMGGSISWAFLCVFAGLFCDGFGLKYFPLFGVFLTIVMAVFSMTMNWEAIKPQNSYPMLTQKEEGLSNVREPHSILYLLGNYKIYTIFLIGSALMFMGYDFGSIFMIDIFTGLGGNNTHYGIAQFVLAIAEVPSAFLVIKARKRISMKWVMVCCAIFMTLKNLIPTYTTHIWIVIAAQGCEMLGFGLYYAGGIYLIEELIPEEDTVKATTLISIFTVGVGEGIASLFIGIIHNQFGLYGLMKVGTLTNALAIIVMIFMCFIKTEEENGKQKCLKKKILKT